MSALQVPRGLTLILTLAMLADAGCGGGSSTPAAPAATPTATAGPAITEYPIPTTTARPQYNTVGSDGALWFTEVVGNKIGRITTGGSVTEYPMPAASPAAQPFDITSASDGNLWFTEYQTAQTIGTVTPSGAISQQQSAAGFVWSIAAGPDGALWFTTVGDNILRVTTAGAMTSFPYCTPSGLIEQCTTFNGGVISGNFSGFGITAGPDGAMWFLATSGNTTVVGRITTAGAVTLFPTTAASGTNITAGPDGALWFTDYNSAGNGIGRLTTAGAFTEYPIPTPISQPADITAGSDGALWFTESASNKIGRITTGGTITEYPLPNVNSEPWGIVTGPDGALWFAELTGNRIGRVAAAIQQAAGVTRGR